jgi:hypothetical protein
VRAVVKADAYQFARTLNGRKQRHFGLRDKVTRRMNRRIHREIDRRSRAGIDLNLITVSHAVLNGAFPTESYDAHSEFLDLIGR